MVVDVTVTHSHYPIIPIYSHCDSTLLLFKPELLLVLLVLVIALELED